METKKIRVVFGVIMPNGQYNNDKSITYSVPRETTMSENDEYANRWKELVQVDMESYCRLIGATPKAIMAPGVFHKDYQREIVY